MNNIIAQYGCVSLSPELQHCLAASMSLATIPNHAKRIALNFLHSDYRRHRTGPHPVEIHLTRQTNNDVWKVATMTSFAFPYDSSTEMDVELYFNFTHQWFYQPDIKRCELSQPKAIELFKSWQQALVRVFHNGGFDSFAVTTLKHFPQTPH